MANNETVLKGTYCILTRLNFDAVISVGKLGELDFQKGHYVYVGSALNSLMPRIKRHLSTDKKLHWHVDYFLVHRDVEVVDILYTVDDIKWECKLASLISENASGIENFGSSDCKCNSHLFYFKQLEEMENSCISAFKKLDLELKRSDLGN